MRYEIAGISDKGNVRPDNQDSILMCCEGDTALLAVADGMGGLACGKQASQLAVDILRAAWPDIQCAADMEEASALLEDAIYEAHRQIFYLAESIGERTGSTLSVLFLKGRMYRIKQIGDSRIYCVRRGKIEQLTVDQTWCNMMVQTGQLDEEQAARHRMRHFLVNALGVSQELEIADEQGTVRGGECYLLCSDGFYNEAAVENVPEILYRQNLAQALEELLSDILRGQARDNVSVVACAVFLL